MLHEMRIGESRAQALKSLADRIDLPETTSFVRSIVQADQLGISLGRILRVQGQDMRNRRQMAAEEKAMKAPVKMLFPTVLFIFPAMFVVVLGPAMLRSARSSAAAEPGAERLAPRRSGRMVRASWRRGRVVRQRPAKPCTPVRIRPSPLADLSRFSCS